MGITLDELVSKARAIEARQNQCHESGGHRYEVDGFSEIAHPRWKGLPRGDVVFRAYVCNRCGCRVSVEEGRRYMWELWRQKRETREALIELYGEEMARAFYPWVFPE